MLHWSVRQLQLFLSNTPWMYATIIVASLNMLVQIMFDMMFGKKSVMRIGGER